MGIRRPHSVSTQLCGASLLNTLHFTGLSNYITSTILVRKGEKRYKGGDKDLVATKVKKGSNSIKDYIHFVSLTRLCFTFIYRIKELGFFCH